MSSSPDLVADPAADVVAAAPAPMHLPRLTVLPSHDDDAAFAAGFAAGYADGLRRASHQARSDAQASRRREVEALADRADATARATAAVADAAAALTATADEVVAGVSDTLAGGVLILAEAVVGAELTEPGHRAVTALRRALAGVAEVGGATSVTVRLNPEDMAALDTTAVATGVSLVPDPAVLPGDALADAGPVLVDARVADALARAAEAVRA